MQYVINVGPNVEVDVEALERKLSELDRGRGRKGWRLIRRFRAAWRAFRRAP